MAKSIKNRVFGSGVPDWLKAKIEAELSFPKWLRKQGKYRWSGIAETFIRNKTKSTDSSPSPWWNKMYEQYLEDTKDDPKYSKLKKTGFPILHLQEIRGQRPTQGLRKSDDIDIFVDERIGDSTETKSQLYIVKHWIQTTLLKRNSKVRLRLLF